MSSSGVLHKYYIPCSVEIPKNIHNSIKNILDKDTQSLCSSMIKSNGNFMGIVESTKDSRSPVGRCQNLVKKLNSFYNKPIFHEGNSEKIGIGYTHSESDYITAIQFSVKNDEDLIFLTSKKDTYWKDYFTKAIDNRMNNMNTNLDYITKNLSEFNKPGVGYSNGSNDSISTIAGSSNTIKSSFGSILSFPSKTFNTGDNIQGLKGMNVNLGQGNFNPQGGSFGFMNKAPLPVFNPPNPTPNIQSNTGMNIQNTNVWKEHSESIINDKKKRTTIAGNKNMKSFFDKFNK